MRLAELAERLGGVLIGDSEAVITGVAGIREASEGDLTFLASPRYAVYADQTNATAILVANGARGIKKPVIQIDDPYAAFLEAAKLFRPAAEQRRPGVHPTAVIGAGVQLGVGVSIGAHVVIESGAVVGEETAIAALCFLGSGSRVGARCSIHPGVIIGERCVLGDEVVVHAGAVIGSDGFGFAWNGRGHRKIPQVGAVVIEDDVEIGANCAIDRGTVGDTRVGRGCRLDNLVHIGHNVQVGEHSLLIAQVGIGGSTRIGRHVTLAGQVGIVGHVEIGDGTQIGAQAGVIHSVPPGSRVWGYPAMPLAQSKRVYASIKRTPRLLKQVRELEERLENLERCLENGGPTSARETPAAGRHGQPEDD